MLSHRLDDESISNMVKTVVREHHYSPFQIEEMFLDSEDFLGLEFWYDDVLQTIKEFKEK